MTERQRELKRERDRRYRERKKARSLPEIETTPVNDEKIRKHGSVSAANWHEEQLGRKRVTEIIRNEIRLRHRHQAIREMTGLESKVKRRLEDALHFGGAAQYLETFQDIEEFANASRREIWLAFGQEPGDSFVDYGGDE